jgi:glycosyltransferase involved in cell wall biosynthesis
MTEKGRPSPCTTVVIATYNWKEALAALLATIRAQWELPDEVIIADDGSRSETAMMIADQTSTFPVPLRHVWHEDMGFRLGAIRNRAMAIAIGTYLIQLDGDLLLHPGFVRAHRRFARRGSYVQGSRAMLDEWRTRRTLAERGATALPSPFSRGVRNRSNGIYLPWLARLVRGPRGPLTRTRGAHMAFWRDDVLRVNGYDEDIEGWGREDSELAARLMNAGVRRRNLKFSAVAWHLHHAVRPDNNVARNHELFERTVRERRLQCEHGIDRYLNDGRSGRDRIVSASMPGGSGPA